MKNFKIISILLVVVLIVLAGCGGSGAKPEKTVEDCLNAIREGKLDSVNQYVLDGEASLSNVEDERNEVVLNEAFKKLEYEILESKVEGENAQVKVKIVAPDMAKIMGQLMISALNNAFSGDSEEAMQEKMNNEMKEIFNSNSFEMVTSEVVVSLKQKDDKWLIDANEQFVNAITGNLLEVMNELSNISIGS
jgi:hypothetical protein